MHERRDAVVQVALSDERRRAYTPHPTARVALLPKRGLVAAGIQRRRAHPRLAAHLHRGLLHRALRVDQHRALQEVGGGLTGRADEHPRDTVLVVAVVPVDRRRYRNDGLEVLRPARVTERRDLCLRSTGVREPVHAHAPIGPRGVAADVLHHLSTVVDLVR